MKKKNWARVKAVGIENEGIKKETRQDLEDRGEGNPRWQLQAWVSGWERTEISTLVRDAGGR